MQIFGVLPVSNCMSPQTPHNIRAGIDLPSTSVGQPPTYLEKYEEAAIDNDVQDEGLLAYRRTPALVIRIEYLYMQCSNECRPKAESVTFDT